MRKYRTSLLVIALAIISISAMSQGKEAEAAWSKIKADQQYVYGEGLGNTVKEADNNALHDLLSKISLHVSSSFNIEETEINTNDSFDSKTAVKSLVETYTNGTLTNTEKMVVSDEPDAKVGRYIKKSELLKIFENRKSHVKDMLDIACSAEAKGRIDIALRNYYWAYLLTRSLQHPSEMRYTTADDNVDHSVISWVPEHINVIFDNIRIKVLQRRNDDVDLLFTYKGKPVTSLDFRYQDGREWTNIASVQDGAATMELAAGFKTSAYKVALEFMYKEEALIDADIKCVVPLIKNPKNLIDQSYINVPSEDNTQVAVTPDPVAQKSSANGDDYISDDSFSTINKMAYEKPAQMADSTHYKKVVQQIVNAIQNKNANDTQLDGYFTEHGLKAYNSLIRYGNASVIGMPSFQYYSFMNETIVRGLKMQFKFQNGVRKSFVEEIVFTFNSDGKIDNLAFGLDKTAEDDILGKGVWNETTRYAIMQFLENYKTAYAMKDIGYIEGVFDKDATIITGYVTKKAVNSNVDNGGISLNVDQVTYQKYTKDEYISKLKRSFASKEFINIRFSNNEIIKLGKGGESFAIQIVQDYYSSNYGDKGYLMLMVDLNNPHEPVIKVRTWQPERDPKFGLWSASDFK